MDNALNTWNASPKINIIKDSNTPNYVVAGQYTDEWYGIYAYGGSGISLTFVIGLNSRTIARDAVNGQNFIRSVFAHELGHSLCLDDNPNTTSSSLMKHTRDRNTLYVPQTYDWNDINTHF